MHTVTLTVELQKCAGMRMMPDMQACLHDMHPDLKLSYKRVFGRD